MKIIKFLLATLLQIAVCSSTAATVAIPIAVTISPINVSFVASDCATDQLINCRVPKAIWFDATGTTDVSVTSNPFHDLQYVWDFGDPGSGSWTTTTSHGNTSRNAAYGAVAAHVYENAGPYTVTLTVYDGANPIVTQTQTVYPIAWPNTSTTHCFSTGSDFTGCPSNGQTHTDATGNLNTVIATYAASGSDARLLFKGGETWTTSGNSSISKNNVYIGSFSSGTATLARAAASPGDVLRVRAADVRVVDISLDGINISNSGDAGISLAQNTNPYGPLTILRVNNSRSSYAYNIQGTKIAIVDSVIGTTSSGGGTNYGCFCGVLTTNGGRHFAFLGNTVNTTSLAIHALRSPGNYKSVFSNNYIYTSSSTAMDMQAYVWNGSNATEYVIISDNRLTGQGGFGNDSGQISYIRNTIVERNWFDGSPTRTAWYSGPASYSTLRNNVHNIAGSTGAYMFAVGPGYPDPTNVWLYNNSYYSTAASNISMIRIMSYGATSGIIIKNNLSYIPNATNNYTFSTAYPTIWTNEDSATNITSSNNSTDTSGSAQVKTTNPYNATPTTPATFALSAGSYGVNGGVSVPVWSDFGLNAITGTREIGAWQY